MRMHSGPSAASAIVGRPFTQTGRQFISRATELTFCSGAAAGSCREPPLGDRRGDEQTTTDDEQGRGLALIDGLIDLNSGTRGIVDDADGPGKIVYVAIA